VTDTSAFLELYDDALPHVYGYLARRCANAATAEDLTAETFMAAVAALHNSTATDGNRLDFNTLHINPGHINTAWLIGTARHKLIDHWRRTERRKEELADLWDDIAVPDPTDAVVEVATANAVLAALAPQHRTVHATEALLTRAKAAFRNHSGGSTDGPPDRPRDKPRDERDST
jgi:RNA polymerase sigma-70 factor (ECF subfamily)